VLKALTKCLRQFVSEREMQILVDQREAEYLKTAYEKQKKDLVERMHKAEDPKDILKDLLHLDTKIDAVVVPPSAELVSDDSTPEALTNCLQERGGRTVVMSTEASLFDQMGGMYKERGKPANLSVYLQAWSGDPIVIDRKDRKGRLEKPLLVVCITAQPSMVAALGANSELVGRGALARFMYAVPPSMVGYRDRHKVLERLDPAMVDAYNDRMLQIGRQCASWQTPAILSLDSDARDIFIAWDQDLEDRQRGGKDLAGMREWASKLRASILRLVGILHFADGRGIHDEVDMATLDRALDIGDYWIAHAAVVHRMWGRDEADHRAWRVAEWIADEAGPTFTASQAQQALHGTFPKVDDIVDPLEMLIERGWIRPDFDGPLVVGRRGKASPSFLVHPEISHYVAITRKGDEWSP
jgi:hypothetical protein